ncbi:MAG TPA: efflux RND transporter periplasmic adaptor subunit [Gemmataceae bacterium]|jgi:membrane fusion protein, multidrug efflux system|nr:efflux RND transporter periplasmic adaptor subunit [Gemmataceae bacterium]
MKTTISMFLLCLMLTGCTHAPAEIAGTAPPSVPVSYPVEREITEYADYTGRTAAVDSVEVRSHVWGYLEKVNFKEGDPVMKDDVLFKLDARPYVAALDQAKAKVAQDQAQLKFDEAEYQRAFKLVSSGAVTKSDLDKTAAARDVDIANIKAAEAAVAARELDVEYTNVRAPVSGRAGRYVVTVGNLIQSGDQGGGTLLTTIVSVDPMYVYFDADEYTVLRVRKLIREGKAKSARDVPDLPAWLGLANEEGHPHKGVLNFVDNQVNPKTGTLRLRGVFPNKDDALAPGYFARVRINIGFPHPALLINDRAIDTDQGQKIVYVVGEDNKVSTRPVRVGKIYAGLREITHGLKAGDRVIVNGLQQVRPGLVVEPKLADMPVSASSRGVRNAMGE